MFKQHKAKIIALSIIILLIAGTVRYVNYLMDKPLDIEIPKHFVYNNTKIALAWTDDNTGENLIIQSDKKNYYGFSSAEIYFSITNISRREQNMDVVIWLPSEKAEAEKIERINKDGSNFEFPILNFEINSNFEFKNRKDVGGSDNGYAVNDEIKSGQTNYYKATLKYPPMSKGEFFIEAFGKDTECPIGHSVSCGYSAYGHLDPWYSSSWSYRRQVTLQSSQIATTTSAFPVLATTTLADLKTTTHDGKVASSTGADIVFADSAGVLLNYEREYYASTTGEIAYWIKTDISSTTDTVLYMYYGNSDMQTDLATTTGVWDDNYVMVQHLAHDGTATTTYPDFLDSTQYDNDGSSKNMNSDDLVDGQIDGGLDFDGGDDYVDVDTVTGDITLDDTGTIAVWVYPRDINSGRQILAFNADALANPRLNFLVYDGYIKFFVEGANATRYDVVVTEDVWTHIIITSDGSSHKYYKNGIDVTPSPSVGSNDGKWFNDLNTITKGNIGRLISSNPLFFNGLIDEVRISNVARTAGWIETEYNNQVSAGDFMSFGAEESNIPTITSVTDSPDPAQHSSTITFSVDWNDADAGETVKIKICKTDSLTGQNCDNGHYASSTAFTTDDPVEATYAVQADDFGSKDYYAFVCDDDGNCSGSAHGSFTISITQINSPITNKFTSGLVGNWSFNGKDMDWASSTAEALDRSGQGNNGNVIGAKAVIGKVGQGLEFDGVGDYVSIGNAGSGIKTISFWIKADDIISRKIIDIDGTDQIETDASGNILATDFPAATVYVDGATASAITTDWHFVVITDTTGVNASAMDIGRVSTGYFDGLIDEVRIYNRALSAEEIAEQYRTWVRRLQVNTPITNKLTSGLVGNWSFNGQDMDWASSTAEALDRSGQGNNGNVIGAKAAIGKVGQGMEFDGSDDYIDAGDVYNGIKTVAFWIKADSTDDTTYFDGKLDEVRFYSNALSADQIGQLYRAGARSMKFINDSGSGSDTSLSAVRPTSKIIDLNGTANIEVVSGIITANGFTDSVIYVDASVASTTDDGWRFVTITTGTGINASAARLGAVGFLCGIDQLTDYDSNTYNTIQIGDQCWMAENLMVLHNADGSNPKGTGDQDTTPPVAFDDADWEATEGYLYNWEDATNGGTTQGICPTGWHLPSHDEWTDLERYICEQEGGSTCDADFPKDNTTGWKGTHDEGRELKAINNVNGQAGATNGDDGYGFTGLLAGYRVNTGAFYNRGTCALFWSSTQFDASSAWYRYLDSSNASVSRSYYDKGGGFSVRCLKD